MTDSQPMTLYDKLTENDAILSVTLDCSDCGYHKYGIVPMSNVNLNRLKCEGCGEQTWQVSEVYCVSGKTETGDIFQAMSKRYQLSQIEEDV